MRIEKVSNRAYAKMLDTTEHGFVDIINKYFNSTVFNSTGTGGLSGLDRETFIQEIITRILPIIISTSESIYTRELERVIEECIRTCSGMIGSGGGGVPLNHIIYTKYIEPIDDRTILMLPPDKYMTIARGDIDFRVNGAEQESPTNYSYILNPADNMSVIGFNFGVPMFTIGDIVTVEYTSDPSTRRIEFIKTIDAGDNKQIVYLDNNTVITLEGQIRVLVNGVEEDGGATYNIIPTSTDSNRLYAIDFLSPILEIDDVITIGY